MSADKSDNGWSPYTSSTDIVDNNMDGAANRKPANTFFVWFLSCFATIGGLLFGYDTGIVSGSMLLIKPYFDLTTVWEEGIVSGTIGAAAIFALLAGFVCDWLGRKKTIMIASFVFAVGAIVMAVSDSKELLLGGRIIVGIGIGFASMTVPVYVAESAPAEIRGRLVTLNQLFITIGIVLSSIIAGAFSDMKDTGWRYMLGLAAAPGVIQFFGFIYLPESPRWLISKGRDEDARKVLRRIRGYEDVEEEFLEVKEGEKGQEGGFALGQILRTPHVRKALFVGCGLQLFQQLCGINTVIYYSATILKQAGFPPSQAIWLVCVPFGVNFLATFIGLWAVEKLGRKMLLIISFAGVTVALIVLAVGFLLSIKHSPAVNGTMPVTYLNGSLVTDECQGYTGKRDKWVKKTMSVSVEECQKGEPYLSKQILMSVDIPVPQCQCAVCCLVENTTMLSPDSQKMELRELDLVDHGRHVFTLIRKNRPWQRQHVQCCINPRPLTRRTLQVETGANDVVNKVYRLKMLPPGKVIKDKSKEKRINKDKRS